MHQNDCDTDLSCGFLTFAVSSHIVNITSNKRGFVVLPAVRKEGFLWGSEWVSAARYLVPGLVAHESALRGGELLEIRDFGDPPSSHV